VSQERAGWAGPQGEKERGKRKRRVGRPNYEKRGKKKCFSNAFEFEFEI
jgi:hypothetical protein